MDSLAQALEASAASRSSRLTGTPSTFLRLGSRFTTCNTIRPIRQALPAGCITTGKQIGLGDLAFHKRVISQSNEVLPSSQALQDAADEPCPCEVLHTGKQHQGNVPASMRYSGVPVAGMRGLPIRSNSSSLPLPLRRSTSDQSFILLLDISNIRRLGRRSTPACVYHAQQNVDAACQILSMPNMYRLHATQ